MLIFAKNPSNFESLPWKLDNPYLIFLELEAKTSVLSLNLIKFDLEIGDLILSLIVLVFPIIDFALKFTLVFLL